MTETQIKTNQGAKLQSTHYDNPRSLLAELIETSPYGRDKQKLFAEFRHTILYEDYAGYLDTIIEYWFANNYYALTKTSTNTRDNKIVTRQKIEKIKHKMINNILDKMKLPNGKLLRNCTGEECRQAGGMFTKIAKCVPNNETVGAHLTDKDVRQIWREEKS